MLALFCGVHLMAEFGHFLITVITKSVAHDVHYGNLGCFKAEEVYSTNQSIANICEFFNSSET